MRQNVHESLRCRFCSDFSKEVQQYRVAVQINRVLALCRSCKNVAEMCWQTQLEPLVMRLDIDVTDW